MKISREAKAAIVVAATLFSSLAYADDAGINVKVIGSFYVGGTTVKVDGLPKREITYSPGSPPVQVEQNGDFMTGQMYVHYTKLEKPVASVPILMWHGGGMTGVNWETKPDGQPGWEMYFLHHGWDVFTSDAVERGRSSWSRYPEVFKDAPFFRTKKEAWELFRFGTHYDSDPSKRIAAPGTRFPIESFDEFVKQSVPRWTSNDVITQNAYDEYVKKACPCVIMVHRQGGNFAYNAALKFPDKVKALVLLETSGSPDPDKTDFSKLKNTPMLWVWGDNTDSTQFWRDIVARQEKVRARIDQLGGIGDAIFLPKLGIEGNSHMLMMDNNSDQIAGLINEWLTKRGLTKAVE